MQNEFSGRLCVPRRRAARARQPGVRGVCCYPHPHHWRRQRHRRRGPRLSLLMRRWASPINPSSTPSTAENVPATRHAARAMTWPGSACRCRTMSMCSYSARSHHCTGPSPTWLSYISRATPLGANWSVTTRTRTRPSCPWRMWRRQIERQSTTRCMLVKLGFGNCGAGLAQHLCTTTMRRRRLCRRANWGPSQCGTANLVKRCLFRSEGNRGGARVPFGSARREPEAREAERARCDRRFRPYVSIGLPLLSITFALTPRPSGRQF